MDMAAMGMPTALRNTQEGHWAGSQRINPMRKETKEKEIERDQVRLRHHQLHYVGATEQDSLEDIMLMLTSHCNMLMAEETNMLVVEKL